MIKVGYNHKRNIVIVEFIGKIDVAQAEQSYLDIQKIIPQCSNGFKILTDLSRIESMDSKGIDMIKKSMDFFNSKGVTEVVRIVPDPSKDIGFNIMSLFHYSKNVKFITVESRKESEELFS